MEQKTLLALLDYLNRKEGIDLDVLEELELIYNINNEDIELLFEEIKNAKLKTTRYLTTKELLEIMYLEFHDALNEYELYEEVISAGITLDSELAGDVIIEQEQLINKINLYTKLFVSYEPKKSLIR